MGYLEEKGCYPIGCRFRIRGAEGEIFDGEEDLLTREVLMAFVESCCFLFFSNLKIANMVCLMEGSKVSLGCVGACDIISELGMDVLVDNLRH